MTLTYALDVACGVGSCAEPAVQQALLPGFLDPVNLLNSFGTWALAGLLIVIFIESGVLFPILPGDSLLFVAGLIAASKSADIAPFAPLWVICLTVPISAIAGGQIGYWIGRYVGTSMFGPDKKILKQHYLDEAHAFFEKHGPITIFLARFVPIVRTLAPLVAGAAQMKYRVFVVYNVVGAVVWGAGLVLLGYWLGQFSIIADNVDIIFVGIVLVSVLPIVFEYAKRVRAGRRESAPDQPGR